MENTITQIFFRDTFMHHLARAQYNIDPNYAAWIDLLTEMNFGEERGAWRGTNGEPDTMAEAYERWNQEVKTQCRRTACSSGTRRKAGSRSASSSRWTSRSSRSRTSTTRRTSRRT